MIMQPSGENFRIAVFIYQRVGKERFRCSDLEPHYPMFRSMLQGLCNCGILVKYRFVHRNRINEYQLTIEAIESIERNSAFVAEEMVNVQ